MGPLRPPLPALLATSLAVLSIASAKILQREPVVNSPLPPQNGARSNDAQPDSEPQRTVKGEEKRTGQSADTGRLLEPSGIQTSLSGVTGTLFSGAPFRTYPEPLTLQVNNFVQWGGQQCAQWAVVTTIHPMSAAVEDVLNLPDWCTVIIGDEQTPAYDMRRYVQSMSTAVFLDVTEQKALAAAFPELLQLLPWRHFARKNLGYLYAIAHGAVKIWDFDDDNIRLPGVQLGYIPQHMQMFQELGSSLRPSSSSSSSGSGSGNSSVLMAGDLQGPEERAACAAVNPYPVMGCPKTPCWPRGFPLPQLQRDCPMTLRTASPAELESVAVLQSLADEEPDVDAIFRLTMGTPFNFMEHGAHSPATDLPPSAATAAGAVAALPVMVPHGKLAPYNGQAQLTLQPAFWGLLLPVTVHGRVSDIWRSFITQRLLWDTGYSLAFTPPRVVQKRNPHNSLADFAAELPLYQQTPQLLRFLLEWSSTAPSLPERYLQLLVALYERGYIEQQDVQLGQAWIVSLARVGYSFPLPVETGAQAHTQPQQGLRSSRPFFEPGVPSFNGRINLPLHLVSPVSSFSLNQQLGGQLPSLPALKEEVQLQVLDGSPLPFACQGVAGRKRVLITGATGLLGSAVLRQLVELQQNLLQEAVNGASSLNSSNLLASAACWRLYGLAHSGSSSAERMAGLLEHVELLQGDLLDKRASKQLLRALQPSLILHLAASRAELPEQRVLQDMEMLQNLLAGLEELQATRAATPSLPPPHLVLASSGEVYGAASAAIVAAAGEEAFQQGGFHAAVAETASSLLLPSSLEGRGKLLQEQLAEEFSSRSGVAVTVARFVSLLGPHGQQSSWLDGLCRQLALAELGKASVPAFDSSWFRQATDMLDPRDAGRLLLAAVRAGRPGETYNIGRGRASSRLEVLTVLSLVSRIRLPPLTHTAMALEEELAAQRQGRPKDGSVMQKLAEQAHSQPLPALLPNVAKLQAAVRGAAGDRVVSQELALLGLLSSTSTSTEAASAAAGDDTAASSSAGQLWQVQQPLLSLQDSVHAVLSYWRRKMAQLYPAALGAGAGAGAAAGGGDTSPSAPPVMTQSTIITFSADNSSSSSGTSAATMESGWHQHMSRAQRLQDCPLSNLDVFVATFIKDMPITALLLNSLRTFMPCYGTLHLLIDPQDVAIVQAWTGYDPSSMRLYIMRPPPALQHLPGYILQAWVMHWADRYVLGSRFRASREEEAFLAAEQEVADRAAAAASAAAEGECRPLEGLSPDSGSPPLCYSPSSVQELYSPSSYTPDHEPEYVMFLDTDSVMGMPVTCNSLFDEQGRVRVGAWSIAKQVQFHGPCEELIGNCSSSGMAFFPITLPLTMLEPLRRHMVARIAASSAGAVGPAAPFDIALGSWTKRPGVNYMQFSQFVAMLEYARQYGQQSVRITSCNYYGNHLGTECADWSPGAAHLGWRYCSFLAPYDGCLNNEEYRGKDMGEFKKYSKKFGLTTIEATEAIVARGYCMQELLRGLAEVEREREREGGSRQRPVRVPSICNGTLAEGLHLHPEILPYGTAHHPRLQAVKHLFTPDLPGPICRLRRKVQ